MEFAALSLSALALLVSIWSAFNSHKNRKASERSANAAELSAQASNLSAESSSEIAHVERSRRYEELAPPLTASYDGVLQRQGGVEYRGIVISVAGQHRYVDVGAKLIQSPRGTHEAATDLIGIEGSSEVGEEISLGPVQGGDELRVALSLRRREDGAVAGGRVRMLFEFVDENGWHWSQIEHVDVPGDPWAATL